MAARVEITLDKPRTLYFDWAAVRRLYNDHGINMLQLDEAVFQNPNTVSALLWAGLAHEDADLTQEDVDRLFSFGKLGYITEKIGEALQREMDDPFFVTSSASSMASSS